MREEIFKQMQEAAKATLLEIKNQGHSERFHEMLFIVRHTNPFSTTPNCTEFKIALTTYKLVETVRRDWRIDISTPNAKGEDTVVGEIIYDGEDYRLTDQIERSTTRYIDLLKDEIARIGIIYRYL